ncbi:hypothetical protein B0H19DRAFT_1065490 [Mycena capillaripes]|nr:hypothetical protein B0H19DRAFT_1065490 [Mycena capillaripes]
MKSFSLLVFLMHLYLTATTLVAAAPLDHIPAMTRSNAQYLNQCGVFLKKGRFRGVAVSYSLSSDLSIVGSCYVQVETEMREAPESSEETREAERLAPIGKEQLGDSERSGRDEGRIEAVWRGLICGLEFAILAEEHWNSPGII